MAYLEGAGSGDDGSADSGGDGACVLCRLRDSADDEALVLERTAHTYTVMNAYPYTTGHVMVVPLRHIGEMEGLDAGESAAMFGAMQRAVVAIKTAMHCDGLNVGANLGRVAGAGVPGHVHMHALPRWDGDTNFMTTVAEARVLPEDLRTTWSKLRAAWPPPR
jgi:ATP adenylyltransferase